MLSLYNLKDMVYLKIVILITFRQAEMQVFNIQF